jgi:hypothetical protein
LRPRLSSRIAGSVTRWVSSTIRDDRIMVAANLLPRVFYPPGNWQRQIPQAKPTAFSCISKSP